MAIADGVVTAETIVIVSLVHAIAGLVFVETLKETTIDKRYELKETGNLFLADFEQLLIAVE